MTEKERQRFRKNCTAPMGQTVRCVFWKREQIFFETEDEKERHAYFFGPMKQPIVKPRFMTDGKRVNVKELALTWFDPRGITELRSTFNECGNSHCINPKHIMLRNNKRKAVDEPDSTPMSPTPNSSPASMTDSEHSCND